MEIVAKDLAFPFLELPEEIQGEVVAYLDSPSRLSLSMASRHFRSKLFTTKGFFNNWVFLDETIRRGYAALLKYAFENGSAIDYRELVVSFLSNQSDIAQWILSGPFPEEKLNKFDIVCRQYLCETAARYGDVTLVKLIYDDRVTNLDRYYLQGGHIHLIPNLFESVKKKPNSDFVRSAAMGGHGDLAFKLCKDPSHPTIDELREMFHGATNGHPDLMRQVLDRVAAMGCRYSEFFSGLYEPLSRSPEVLSVIAEFYPEYFALHIDDSRYFFDVGEPVRLETLKILKNINLDLAMFFSLNSRYFLERCPIL